MKLKLTFKLNREIFGEWDDSPVEIYQNVRHFKIQNGNFYIYFKNNTKKFIWNDEDQKLIKWEWI